MDRTRRSDDNWVKNMYQKIESACQDIDDFVYKEPVLYVGNQMQTVCKNVKKFYTEVMQDFVLPQMEDPRTHLAQLMPPKCTDLFETSTSLVAAINTVGTNINKPKEAPLVPKMCHRESKNDHTSSEISVPHNSTSDQTIQAPLSAATSDPETSSKNDVENVSSERLHDEIFQRLFGDDNESSESEEDSESEDDNMVKENVEVESSQPKLSRRRRLIISSESDDDSESEDENWGRKKSEVELSIEERLYRLINCSAEDFSRPSLKNTVVEPVTVYRIPTESRGYVSSNVCTRPASSSNAVSDDASSTSTNESVYITPSMSTKFLDSVETSTRSVAAVKENAVNTNTDLPKEAPLVPENIHEHIISEISVPQNDTSNQNIQARLSYTTSDQETSLKNYLENIPSERLHNENFQKLFGDDNESSQNDDDSKLEDEDLGNDKKTEVDPSVQELSELKSMNTCDENKEDSSNSSLQSAVVEPDTNYCSPTVAMGYVSSNDSSTHASSTYAVSDDISRTDESVPITGFGRSDLCQDWNLLQFEASSWSEIGGASKGSTVQFVEPKMDSIDLSDNKHLAESCVMVEENLLSFPNKSRRNRSYKKMLQDAFTLKKRLTKEYEQLAILYGDMDKELKPIDNGTTLKSPAQDIPDSEWEML